MAYRHTLSIRAAIMARQCHPSVCHILHDKDDHKYHSLDEIFSLPNESSFLQRRFCGKSLDKPIANGSGRYRERRFLDALIFPSSCYALCRHMSTDINVWVSLLFGGT